MTDIPNFVVCYIEVYLNYPEICICHVEVAVASHFLSLTMVLSATENAQCVELFIEWGKSVTTFQKKYGKNTAFTSGLRDNMSSCIGTTNCPTHLTTSRTEHFLLLTNPSSTTESVKQQQLSHDRYKSLDSLKRLLYNIPLNLECLSAESS